MPPEMTTIGRACAGGGSHSPRSNAGPGSPSKWRGARCNPLIRRRLRLTTRLWLILLSLSRQPPPAASPDATPTPSHRPPWRSWASSSVVFPAQIHVGRAKEIDFLPLLYIAGHRTHPIHGLTSSAVKNSWVGFWHSSTHMPLHLDSSRKRQRSITTLDFHVSPLRGSTAWSSHSAASEKGV